MLKSLAGEIAKRETAISAKIKATPDFAERAEIIESVPGFVETSSANLIAGMPELGQGRRWVRNAIYVPCLGAATQNNPLLKDFYERLIAKGKGPKVALVTCMCKLIVILNTLIARRQK